MKSLTLDDILQDIHAMREDLLVFERKYGMPTEVFYEAYKNGEEPEDSAWVLDWSTWAASYEILEERLTLYKDAVRQLQARSTLTELIARTARHEPIALPA
jgi:hypothetical protein